MHRTEVTTVDHLTDLEREAMLSSATVGVVFTRDHHILHANPFFERMFEYSSGELTGKHVSIVFPSVQEFEDVEAYSTPLFKRRDIVELERVTLRKSGSTFWCRMLGQVIDSTDKNLKGIIWIVEDISERKAFESELKLAAEKAQAASKAKSLFLANASHELRTPLNGLIGLATLAQRQDINSRLRDQYLQQIVEISKNLNSIVTNILDLSKIESNALELEEMPFLLSHILRSVHGTFFSLAANKGLYFHINVHEDVEDAVIGDSTRLKQILGNFVNNAIKFTFRGGITINVTSTKTCTRFEVCDTGIGLSASTCKRLFAPFTQADESITRKYGGTGLGLSICKQLAELMGGNVGVRSEVDNGSCFWVEVPLKLIDHGAILPPHNADYDISHLADKTILVIEDNMVNMLITTALLEHQKVKVISAENGQRAIDILKTPVHVDCVLSDIHMPGLSGYETATLIRQLPHRRVLPIIALTAAAFLEDKHNAMACGMNAFLTKPVEATALYREIAIQIAASGNES